MLAEHTGQILRMNRLLAGRALRELVQSGASFLVVGAAGVEKFAVGLGLEFRQKRFERGADVADDAEIELAASSKVLGADIDLRNLDVGRQELLVGEVRPQQ